MRPPPESGDRPALLRSALPAVAILVLLGCLYAYHQEVERLGRAAASLQKEASARDLRDRLLGQRLGELSFADRGGPDGRLRRNGTGPVVLWLVDPGRCVDCLADLSGWRRLSRDRDVENVLVLVGVGRSKALGMAERAGVRSTTWWDEDRSGASEITGGSPPPSLLLLLGPDRTVLGAEVGYRKESCGPERLAQIATLVETLGKETDPVHATAQRPLEEARESGTQRGGIDASTDP